jgi:hypothetical protein
VVALAFVIGFDSFLKARGGVGTQKGRCGWNFIVFTVVQTAQG